MVSFKQELLNDTRDAATSLLWAHWREVALNKDIIPLDPDWDAYERLEDDGKLRIFTARDGIKLVGYFVVIVSSHLHYKSTLFAENDLIYLDPDYRKGHVAARLIRFAEKCLREDGVTVLMINTKDHRPFDPLLVRSGYGLVERVYGKRLR